MDDDDLKRRLEKAKAERNKRFLGEADFWKGYIACLEDIKNERT